MLYIDSCNHAKKLSDEQLGMLFRVIIDYVQTGEKPEISDPMVDIVFGFIAQKL